VVAPVREKGLWALAEDDNIIWDRRFVQLWQQMFSPDGSRLAAIVAPSYGRWTVAVDGVPWAATFTKLVTDATFSPDGQRIAALAKEGETFRVVVDGSPWSDAWDMAWKPVFSPDGKDVAAKVEKRANTPTR
jgi:WD40 repeat protein